MMHNKYDFREPLGEEPDGTYITAGQMQFWLNRRNGTQLFKNGDPVFLAYYNKCRIYNVIYDLMEEDETAAIMYWDSENEAISVGFPSKGSVAYALRTVKLSEDSEELEDDEDTWSAGI